MGAQKLSLIQGKAQKVIRVYVYTYTVSGGMLNSTQYSLIHLK